MIFLEVSHLFPVQAMDISIAKESEFSEQEEEKLGVLQDAAP